MANINLLPWREEAREKQKRDYIGILAAVFLGSAILVYAALALLEMMTDEQRARNAYLQSEIQQLDAQSTSPAESVPVAAAIRRSRDTCRQPDVATRHGAVPFRYPPSR